MNCHDTTRLLPLHAGGDLEAKEELAVARHLLSCAECRREAGEYEESQRWLRLHQPPEFGAAFHESVRRAVMRQINHHGATRFAPASVFARLFRVPLAYALSAALLLAACGAAFVAYRSRLASDRARNETTVAPRPQSILIGLDATRAGSADEVELTNDLDDTRRKAILGGRKSVRAARPLMRPRNRGALIEPPTSPDATTAQNIIPASSDDGATAAIQAEDSSLHESAGIEVADAGPTDDAPEVLRIELQTSDPNIRIIWLAPRKESPPATNINK